MRKCLSAVLAASVLTLPAFPSTAQSTWHSEERCRLAADPLPAAFARCGTITVPLDPATPNGPTIELFVARVAALSAEPRLDPLLLIAGGPGQSTVDFYLQLRGAFEQARRERDIILVDQRGTGRSAEGFACEAPDDLSLDTADSSVLARVIDSCVADLMHDPRFYTTSVAVRDLDAVRGALGLATWTVYGSAYGTRVERLRLPLDEDAEGRLQMIGEQGRQGQHAHHRAGLAESGGRMVNCAVH